MSPGTEPAARERTVILLAGPSGSGKSRVARMAGCPLVALDDFYLDGDHPGLPRTLGIVDWDDSRTWDGEGAVRAIEDLCHSGFADVPLYVIAASRRTGSRRLDASGTRAFVAEGVFAPEVVGPCRDAGLEVVALYLDRPRTLTLVLRFVRDVREHRKRVWVLMRRGLALWRAEGEIRRRAVDSGCRPVTLRQALAVVRNACEQPGMRGSLR